MKYIDVEKLKAEIERRMGKHWEGLPDADSPEDDWTHNELCELGAYKELEHIEDFLNSLQQEQQEVDLEKEIKKHTDLFQADIEYPLRLTAIKFYELGRTEGIKGNLEEIPSNVDLEKAAQDFVWEVMENDEDGISELAKKLRPSSKISDFYDALEEFFKAGAEWQKKQPITFNCIGKQVTMTIQQLINYYIDKECANVADECGF